MALETHQSISGFIASSPQLSATERGDPRFYARVGQEHYRREENGSVTRLKTTYHHLLIIGRAAVHAHAAFKRGDRFIAAGAVRDLPSGEIFLAQRIGHDTARTRYVVQRPGSARTNLAPTPLRPASEQPTPPS